MSKKNGNLNNKRSLSAARSTTTTTIDQLCNVDMSDGEQVIEHASSLNEADFKSLLLSLDDRYFNVQSVHQASHTQIIPDAIYDRLCELFITSFGYAHNKKRVGAPPVVRGNERIKMILPFEMPSLDKVKTEKELELWLQRRPHVAEFVTSAKVDGCSVLFYIHSTSSTNTSNSKQWIASTRGNGRIGVNISHLVPYLTDLPDPNRVDQNGLIGARCELVMTRTNFVSFCKQYKIDVESANPRNTLVGIVNSKTFEPEQAKYISVIAYQAYFKQKESMTPATQFQLLHDCGFITAGPKVVQRCNIGTVEKCTILTKQYKTEVDYDTDGMVIAENVRSVELLRTNTMTLLPFEDDMEMMSMSMMTTLDEDAHDLDNPSDKMAFKIEGECQETTVVEVEWNASKHGFLKPRVRLEPVRCGDVTITYASGFNAKFIQTHVLGPGARILITRSNDVIPFIKEVRSPATLGVPQLPTNVAFQWNDSGIDIVVTDAGNDKQVQIRKMQEFFKTLQADNLGPSTVTKLFHAFEGSLAAILTATKQDLATKAKFQTKTIDNIYNSLQKCQQRVPLSRLMAATSIFGLGLGQRKLDEILRAYPSVLNWQVTNDESQRLRYTSEIESIKGFGKTAAQFVNQLPHFQQWIQEHPSVQYVIPNATTTTTTTTITNHDNSEEKNVDAYNSSSAQITTLYPRVIAMTGMTQFSNPQWKSKLEAAGVIFSDGITKKTELLIIKAKGSGSSKEKKAIAANIPILTETEFGNTYHL